MCFTLFVTGCQSSNYCLWSSAYYPAHSCGSRMGLRCVWSGLTLVSFTRLHNIGVARGVCHTNF